MGVRASANNFDLEILDASGGNVVSQARTQVANLIIRVSFDCPVSSDRKIYWRITDNNINFVDIIMTKYWN